MTSSINGRVVEWELRAAVEICGRRVQVSRKISTTVLDRVSRGFASGFKGLMADMVLSLRERVGGGQK